MIFNSFWHGSAPPLSCMACMSSFVKAGHRYRVYSYSDLKLPPGVELHDARQVLAEDEIFLDVLPDGSVGNIAAFSDLFRYALLKRFGGWWVDTDVLLVGRDIPTSELYFGFEDERYINGAILKAPAGHPLLQRLEERARAAGRSPRRGSIGPRLVTDVVNEMGLANLAARQPEAYPLHYEEFLKLVTAETAKEVRRTIARSTFLHLWNEMFSAEKSPLLQAPERGSFMATAYRDNLSLREYMVICLRQAKRAFGKS